MAQSLQKTVPVNQLSNGPTTTHLGRGCRPSWGVSRFLFDFPFASTLWYLSRASPMHTVIALSNLCLSFTRQWGYKDE